MLNQEQLISKIKNYNSFLDVQKIRDAYDFAEKAHSRQKRDSGDPYIHQTLAEKF